MKKTTLLVVAASLTAVCLGAYAAVPTGAAPFQVVVPNLKSGLEFTLQGLYLQPSNSDLNYATTHASTTSSTAYSTHAVKPNYNFGFGVGLGYVFPDSGNDMQLSWTHFNHDATDITNLVTTPVEGLTDTLSSNAAFKYDAVDLDIGQYLSMGSRLQTRLFAGLRFAQLTNNVTTVHASGLNRAEHASFTEVDTQNLNAKFRGVGPRLGIDTRYHLGNCFGVVAHFASALLVGRVESSAVDVNIFSSGGRQNSTTTFINNDKLTRVVPAFDAKLGVDYTVPFRNDSARMIIEAGYQATQYLDVIDRTHFILGRGIVGSRITSSGVGFNGPYLSLNFKI